MIKNIICDVLRDLVLFPQFTKSKKPHGGVLLLAQLQAKSLKLY